MLWFLALIAALVAPHDLESRGPLPPRSYELSLTAAYADATVTMNGVPILEARVEAKRSFRLLLNAFLKAKGNALEIRLKPAFPGQQVEGSITVRSYVAAGGPESITTEMDRQVKGPFDRQFDFDAPGTPALAVWSAEEAPFDDAARGEIVAGLAAFQTEMMAALEARDTRRLIAVFEAYAGNRDAAHFLPEGGTANAAAAMREQLAPVVNDPVTRQIATAPVPALPDLSFRAVGRYMIVSREDGGAVLGFMFLGDDGPGGMTLDRPVFGRVGGHWVMLQDIPFPR